MQRPKKINAFLFFLIAISSFAQAGVTISDSIFSGGYYRKYRLYVPSIYSGSAAVPLIINLHGYPYSGTHQQNYSNFMPVADTANFLVVHPEGLDGGTGQFWNAGIVAPPPNDVLFLSNLIDSLSLSYNIDANRVYSTGWSNGGIMSYYLACNLPNKIAAIASVAGSMLNSWYSCAPARAFPIMEIHSNVDPNVSYVGDGNYAPMDSIINKWRQHNNCGVTPVTYSVPDINLTDNSTAVNYKYTGGTNGSTVELYKIIGGSHSWPGATPTFTNTNEDFSATVEIWRFFRGYKLNQFITAVENREMELNKIQVYPNPTSGAVKIEGIEKAQLSLFSLDGKKLLSEGNGNTLNIENLSAGLYFLEIKNEHLSKMIKLIKN